MAMMEFYTYFISYQQPSASSVMEWKVCSLLFRSRKSLRETSQKMVVGESKVQRRRLRFWNEGERGGSSRCGFDTGRRDGMIYNLRVEGRWGGEEGWRNTHIHGEEN